MTEWWQEFFDANYLALWRDAIPAARSEAEAEGLEQLLGLRPGSRVLDAPCGFGRLSRALAARGASVVGVDLSEVMLARAEATRQGIGADRLTYLRQDLRRPLPVNGGFDAAINVYSSIGYGTEDDDVAVFATLRAAVRPGGLVFVETMHRDLCVALLSRGARPSSRLDDGTLVLETPTLDPITGRVNTCWYWSGPNGSGSKPASLRVYSATEIVRLLERAGLRFRSAHKGCSPTPFVAEGPEMGGRLGILAERG